MHMPSPLIHVVSTLDNALYPLVPFLVFSFLVIPRPTGSPSSHIHWQRQVQLLEFLLT